MWLCKLTVCWAQCLETTDNGGACVTGHHSGGISVGGREGEKREKVLRGLKSERKEKGFLEKTKGARKKWELRGEGGREKERERTWRAGK